MSNLQKVIEYLIANESKIRPPRRFRIDWQNQFMTDHIANALKYSEQEHLGISKYYYIQYRLGLTLEDLSEINNAGNVTNTVLLLTRYIQEKENINE